MKRRMTFGRCPKCFQGYCRLLAKVMVREHPACDVGKKLIALDWQKRYERRKRKAVAA